MIAVRRAVIFVAQILAFRDNGWRTSGDWLAGAVPALAGAIGALAGARGISIVGALAGFFISTILVALFFLCVEIAHNTRNPFNP